MTNGNKQQSLFSNPLALFLAGVGIVLIAVLAVAMLRPEGQLKTSVRVLTMGACFSNLVEGGEKCQYVLRDQCVGGGSLDDDVFVQGMGCPDPSAKVEYLARNEYADGGTCSQKDKEGKTYAEIASGNCIKSLNKKIADNGEWDGRFYPLCKDGLIPSVPSLVSPTVLFTDSLPIPTPYYCQANCVAVVVCVSPTPTPTPSKTPSSTP